MKDIWMALGLVAVSTLVCPLAHSDIKPYLENAIITESDLSQALQGVATANVEKVCFALGVINTPISELNHARFVHDSDFSTEQTGLIQALADGHMDVRYFCDYVFPGVAPATSVGSGQWQMLARRLAEMHDAALRLIKTLH